MNPNQPSRQEIEAKLTALLLGELPDGEAQLLRYAISQDAGLQKLHDELQATIGLVRVVVNSPAGAAADQTPPLKLSGERRAKLLAHFQTPRPQPKAPLFWLKRIEAPSGKSVLITALVLVLVLGIAALSIPNFVKARATSQSNAVINNLRQIDAAKQQWALENHQPADAVPKAEDLKHYFKNGQLPPPVMGETYVLGRVSDEVAADVDAKKARKELAAFQGKLPVGGAANSQRLRLSASGDLSPAENRAGTAAMAFNSVPVVAPEEAAEPATAAPMAVTVAPAPVLAPPPATIVLPSTADNGEAELALNGRPQTPDDSATHYYGMAEQSKQVQFVREAAQHQVDTQTRMASVEKSWNLPAISSVSSTASEEPVSGSSGGMVFQSSLESQRLPGVSAAATAGVQEERGLVDVNTVTAPKDLGEEFRHAVPASGGVINNQAGTSAITRGGDAWEIATDRLGKADLEVSVAKSLPGSDQRVINELRGQRQTQMRATEGQTVVDGVYSDQAGASPTSGYTLNFGGLPANSPAAVPAATSAPAVPAKPVPGTAAGLFALNDDADKAKAGFDRSGGALDKSGGGTLVLNGGNAYTGGTTINSGTLIVGNGSSVELAKGPAPVQNSGAVVGVVNAFAGAGSLRNMGSGSKFYSTGQTRNDVGGLRYLTSTNAGVARIDGASSAPAVNEEVLRQAKVEAVDRPMPKPSPAAPVPQPEVVCRENNFSTFSLNVSDVSFKLAAASLEKGQMPDAASIRSEEFINAFDYRDPEAKAGQPLAFASERARYPFAYNRDLLRFSVKTAAAGRQAGRALNLVLLLDNSGSMERADRVAIIREALRVLATQLQPQDTVSVVTFARTARLWADGVHGDQAGETLARVGGITPEGGTNLEEAMRLAYETARRHYLASGMNRVVLITDGAANLGDVNPAALKQTVEAQRKQGIALDCFGVGFEDFNDDLLQQLSSNGDGRYAFLNSPEDVEKEFAAKLAGALQVAASDVKVQVEFNPQRVISWRQIGYAKHQLTKEQFRDNTVDAAEIAAQEAGNALYTVETKADGTGPIATVRVRYKVPGTTDYRERSWDVAYVGGAAALQQSSPAMRLAATASAFSEWLAASPFAQEVTPDELLKTLSGVPQVYGADQRPQKLEWMIRQAKSLSGK